MAGVTYKCPSCGAYLTFDPDHQQWSCPFCDSSFEEKELMEREQEYQQEQQNQPEIATDAEGQVAYHCPSCGSSIVTAETTVATHCYYCHNPVVLQGKLTDELRPEGVLPFSISKEKAVKSFMDWVKTKKYIPKGFFDQHQVETMSGVYYPHFINECDVEGELEGEGRNTSVLNTDKYIVTTTKHYRVRRAADMRFSNIMRPALSSQNRKLSDGIHPFPLEDEKPFAGAYLSGFLAEARDVAPEYYEEDIKAEVGKYIRPLLEGDLSYDSHTVSASGKLKTLRSRYVLLPTWVLTYPNKADTKDPYYYAMNGCTGEVCGKLPVDTKKLWLHGALIGAAIVAAACLVFYFLL